MRVCALKYILLIHILFFLIQSSSAVGGEAYSTASPTSDKAIPSYWREMIEAIPREEMPEAVFEGKEPADSEASPIFKKAVASFQEKSYSKAIENLREIMARSPKDDAARYSAFLMADCYARLAGASDGEFLRESISLYLRAVRTYPGSDEAPRGIYQAGRGLFIQGFYYEALAQMDRMSAYYPKSRYVRKALLAKGIIYFYQKKYNMAESVLRRVVSGAADDEDNVSASLWLADTLHMSGRHDEAREIYRTVERARPEHLKKRKLSLLLMGETLMMLKDYNSGRALFEQYLKLYPESPAIPVVMLSMAEALRLEGRKAEAYRLYSRLSSVYPYGDAAIIGKARGAEIDIENGKPDSATLLLQEVLPLKGRVAREASMIIADALNRSGFPLEASRGYESMLSMANGPGVSTLKGKLSESLKSAVKKCYEKKDYLGALKIYHERSRFIKDGGEPELLKIFGDSYMEIGLFSEAVSIYEELLSLKGNAPPSLREDTLLKAVDAYSRLGRKREAEDAMKLLSREFPKKRNRAVKDDARGRENKAELYMDMAERSLEKKQYEDAADYYSKVVSLKDPLFLAKAYIGLGDSYFGAARYKDAADAYDVGKEIGGEKGLWAMYRLGESYLILGDMGKAKAAFQAVSADKGVYGKMALEELNYVGMRIRNPRRID